uniref:Titin n=1 Tax=Trichogramma kaykai TaxID=54128 RepID=A0ABD2X8F2_9HYME
MGNAQKKVAYQPPSLHVPYIPNSTVGSSGTIPKKVHWDRPGLPAPPGKPILIPGDEDSQPDVVGIRWERSPSNGGSAIIGYHVEHRKVGFQHWVRSAPVLCTFPELTLSGLEPGWRYQFRIRAQNAMGMSEPSELSDQLSVTLQRTTALPPKFDIELQDCVALEGQQAKFTVTFLGTPVPKISWYKDDFEIYSSGRTTITTDSGSSVLIIHNITIDCEGEIKCSATNRAGHTSTRAKLIVEAAPRVRIPRQYEEGLLFEQGETIRLKATSGGRPPPSITWYHDGNIIIADERHNFESITDNESILKILDANRQDRGEYSIRTINKLGEDVASFLVTVTDRPSAPSQPRVVGTVGKSFTLSWNEPEDDGGCKIGIYTIEYYRIGWDVWLKAASSRQTTATLNELIEGSQYRFRIKAENPYGVSDPSEPSEVVFVADPKRGITEPNMRAKSASHRDIPRGRSERREYIVRDSGQRTRSLTREEANNRESMNAYDRATSTQRLNASGRPSRADSRVTFALDTTSGEKNEPKRQWSKELLPQPELKSSGLSRSLQPIVVVTRNVNDTAGRSPATSPTPRNYFSFPREHSPFSSPLNNTTENSAEKQQMERSDRSILSPPKVPRRRRSSVDIKNSSASLHSLRRDDEDNMLHGSSEFMLVLYPEKPKSEKQDKSNLNVTPRESKMDKKMLLSESNQDKVNQSVNENAEDSADENFILPPMSLSLPELFSTNHEIVEVLREAISSTELLHERAMERFYKAVEAEKSAEQAKRPSSSALFNKRPPDGDSYPLFGMKIQTVKRKLSNSGAGWQVKRDRRRSSEGQAKIFALKSTKLPNEDILESAISDPNLPTSSEMLAHPKADHTWTKGVGATASGVEDSVERLRRWHEPGIDLSNEASIAEIIDKQHIDDNEKEIFKIPEPLHIKTTISQQNAHLYDEIPMYDDEILAEDSIETSGANSDAASSDSEDIKQLKARILAIPVMEEQETYHPRGRIIMQAEHSEVDTPPPVPPHRVQSRNLMTPPPVPERTHLSPTRLSPAPSMPERTNLSPTRLSPARLSPTRLSPSRLSPASSANSILPKSILKKRNEIEAVPVNDFGRPIPPEKPLRKSMLHDDSTTNTSVFNNRSISSPIRSPEVTPKPVEFSSPLRPTSPTEHSSFIATTTTSTSLSSPVEKFAENTTVTSSIKPQVKPLNSSIASSFVNSSVPSSTINGKIIEPIEPTIPTTMGKMLDSSLPIVSSALSNISSPVTSALTPAVISSISSDKQSSKSINDADADLDKEAVISAAEAAVTKRSRMRQGSRGLSLEEEQEIKEEKKAVVNHYTELVRQYSTPEFRQRSLSRDRETRRYTESPSESRLTSPGPTGSSRSSFTRDKLPVTPGKIIEPIPPIIPAIPIQKAKPIAPEQRSRRESLINDSAGLDLESPTSKRMSRRDSANLSPNLRSRDDASLTRMEFRPSSRNESNTVRSRKFSRDLEYNDESKLTVPSETASTQIPPGTRRSRSRSRNASVDHSRATTPLDVKSEVADQKNRSEQSLNNDDSKIEDRNKKVRLATNFIIDFSLLIVAVYVYLFQKEIFAIPLIIILLYRQIREELNPYLPERWRH